MSTHVVLGAADSLRALVRLLRDGRAPFFTPGAPMRLFYTLGVILICAAVGTSAAGVAVVEFGGDPSIAEAGLALAVGGVVALGVAYWLRPRRHVVPAQDLHAFLRHEQELLGREDR